MEAILKQDNVFIYAKKLKNEVKNDPSFIIKTSSDISSSAYLYGNRVYIECHRYAYAELTIDGIKILTTNQAAGELTFRLSFQKLVAYLNQINVLGVDSFLKNYKKAMEEFKEEMSAQAEKYEASLAMKEDDALRKILMTIKNTLLQLSFLILALSIYMPAGLDNHVYTEAYEHVINLYQE